MKASVRHNLERIKSLNTEFSDDDGELGVLREMLASLRDAMIEKSGGWDAFVVGPHGEWITDMMAHPSAVVVVAALMLLEDEA